MARPKIDHIKDLFRLSLEVYQQSRDDGLEMWDFYENYQFPEDVLSQLIEQGVPAYSYNIIKVVTDRLSGFIGHTVNTVKIEANKQSDIPLASVLHEIVNHTFRSNQMESGGVAMSIDALLTGLMCAYSYPKETGETDDYGRPKYEIVMEHVPSNQILLDPTSSREDYSDARFIHRYNWIPKDVVKNVLFPDKKALVDQLEANTEMEFTDEAMSFGRRYEYSYTNSFTTDEEYLIVHTITNDYETGKTWSTYWSGHTILRQDEITYRDVKFPYRIMKLSHSDRQTYYSIFRNIVEPQKAINQLLGRLLRSSHGDRWIVERNAVEDINEFRFQASKATSILEVKEDGLGKVRREPNEAEIAQIVQLLEYYINLCYSQLGINPSFLGIAAPSDSGRKVQLQQQSPVSALYPYTSRIQQFYRLLGQDVCNYIKQYYTAYDVVNIADDNIAERWLTLNQPLIDPTNGQPVFEPYRDPASDEIVTDESGYTLYVPIPTRETEIYYSDTRVRIDSVNFDNEMERSQILTEDLMNGRLGQILLENDVKGFLEVSKDLVDSYQLRAGPKIVRSLENAIQRIEAGEAQGSAAQNTEARSDGQQSQTGTIPRPNLRGGNENA